MTVFNWMYALFPFALFCFIAVIFTNKRFSPKVNGAIWAIVIAVIFASHIFGFVLDKKSPLLLHLMPVTAYLPVVITFFVLSASNCISKIFSVLFAALCSVSVNLIYLTIYKIFVRWGKVFRTCTLSVVFWPVPLRRELSDLSFSGSFAKYLHREMWFRISCGISFPRCFVFYYALFGRRIRW